MELSRFIFFIFMMLVFGGIMAEATNYVIITKNQFSNASNQTIYAEFIVPGTFGQAISNGTYIFPSDLYVNSTLYVNGIDILQRLIADNNTQAIFINNIDSSLTALYIRDAADNQTQSNQIDNLQSQINTKGNVSSTGSTPYIPFFSTSTLLENSPVYRASSDKIVVEGTSNFTGTTENSTFFGDVQIIGRLYGGSPVKVEGGLQVISGNSTFNDIYVDSCQGCGVFSYNGTANYSGVNATNITAVNLIVTGNISFPIGSVNWNMLYNYTNVFAGLGLLGGGNLANDVTISINESYFNDTVNYLINQTNFTTRIYNESGIARNYSITGTATGNLPDWERIHISGVITPTTNSALTLNFNSDTGTNYLYRRIQGLVFLYQAVTVNPQMNITLEQTPTATARDIDIIIYKMPGQISGEFSVTTYYNGTYAPFKTMGSFIYKNSTTLNTFNIGPSVTADSYLIVRSETR